MNMRVLMNECDGVCLPCDNVSYFLRSCTHYNFGVMYILCDEINVSAAGDFSIAYSIICYKLYPSSCKQNQTTQIIKQAHK